MAHSTYISDDPLVHAYDVLDSISKVIETEQLLNQASWPLDDEDGANCKSCGTKHRRNPVEAQAAMSLRALSRKANKIRKTLEDYYADQLAAPQVASGS